MVKKFLITGGAGFIGSAVIRHLINDTNDEVVNIDSLTYAGNIETLLSVTSNSRYHFEKVDICNAQEIARIFHQYQPDIVIHLAAESHVDRSIEYPSKFIQTNIVGTYVLLEEARVYWSKLETTKKVNFRFHHVSTDEVYGDLPHPDDDQDSKRNYGAKRNSLGFELAHRSRMAREEHYLPLFTEASHYSPSSPYSASKASSDHLVRAWHRTYGLPTIVTNCSNNYGLFQYPEKLIPLVILNALQGDLIPVYGKGQQIRDWLFVEDHARALVLVAKESKIGETYNIGGHNEKRNIEVVFAICELLEKLVPKKPKNIMYYKDLVTFVKDRAGHDLRYAIDAKKIQIELNWTPLETFKSGIKKTVQWYIENRLWCQQVQGRRYKNID